MYELEALSAPAVERLIGGGRTTVVVAFASIKRRAPLV